jgi:hypothetical protein
MTPSQAPAAPRRLGFTSTRTMVLLLAGGIIAAVVVFVILFSGASLTASSGSPDNALAAGSAGLELAPAETIIDAEDMKPNSVRSGDATVTNKGSRAIVSVQVRGIDAEPELASVLRLKVAAKGDPGAVRYDGPLAGAGRIDLGTQETDAASAWTLTLALPDTLDPALSGKSVAAEFEWMARTP